ncbi:CaiB/BaiF CoA transferase family protein [Kribbella shirazensis]|uniref:Alpha-methylacyl-CoA racemase n=1 Tax=Kribbella shirazensis TaxID=1105143 RepID=A0A7X5VH39_9ACTN|nr:CaiB/BaiF CoA-transferase family protein [Kribbella shirazensis]NIK60038.1 alpha-methylacyl-CoA racemase [Kribbella shirazensis]
MGPLEGVKVVELAGIGPAPFACMMLAELGAEVLRIDRPGGNLSLGPPELDLLNRGRRSVALDLKQPAAVDVVRRLVAQADVLVEGFRPGVAERLGLGPEDCHAVNPRLVYGRMTGWGQDGPLAQSAGHDIDYLALSGALHLIGRAGGPPQVPANLLGDFAGGSLYLVIGVLAALHDAQRSGQGQVVDAAIVDGSAHLTTMLLGALAAGSWRQHRGTNLLDTGAPFYDVYETADGKHVAVGALEPQFYAELIDKLGLDAPDRNDPAQWPELRKVLTETFRQRTQAEWTGVFDGSDACVAPVLPLAADHPHLVARGTFVEHHGVRQAAPAPRFGRTPTSLDRPPARPGEHTREALTDWGITEIDTLLESGAAQEDSTPQN